MMAACGTTDWAEPTMPTGLKDELRPPERDEEHDVEPKVELGVPRHPSTTCSQLFRCNGGSHEVLQRMCTTRTVGPVRKSDPRIPQEDRKNPNASPTSYRVLAEAFV